MSEEINSFGYINSEKTYSFYVPERSDWKCYMFGNKPELNDGIVYHPRKDCEPNWFVRWMMKVCFGCTWVKEKNELRKD